MSFLIGLLILLLCFLLIFLIGVFLLLIFLLVLLFLLCLLIEITFILPIFFHKLLKLLAVAFSIYQFFSAKSTKCHFLHLR